MLDNLLQYQQQPDADDFVLGVMQRVEHEQRTRRLILILSGLIGAAFGLVGAVLLTDTLAPLMTQLLAGKQAAETGCALIVLLAFFVWLLQEDSGLSA